MSSCWRFFVLCGCFAVSQTSAGRSTTKSSSTSSSNVLSSSSTPQPPSDDNVKDAIPQPGFWFSTSPDSPSILLDLIPEGSSELRAALGAENGDTTLALREDNLEQGDVGGKPKLSKGAATALSLGIGVGLSLLAAIALVSYLNSKDKNKHDPFDYDGVLASSSGSFTTVCEGDSPEIITEKAIEHGQGRNTMDWDMSTDGSSQGDIRDTVGGLQGGGSTGSGYIRGAPAYVSIGCARHLADGNNPKPVPLIRSVTADSIATVYDNFAELAAAGLVPSLKYTELISGSLLLPPPLAPVELSSEYNDNPIPPGPSPLKRRRAKPRASINFTRIVDNIDEVEEGEGYGEISGSEEDCDEDNVDWAAVMAAEEAAEEARQEQEHEDFLAQQAEAAEELRQAREHAEWLAEKAAAAAEAAADAVREEQAQNERLEQQAAAVQQAEEAVQEAQAQVQWLARRALNDKSRGDAVGGSGASEGGLGGTLGTSQHLRPSEGSASSVDWMAEMEQQEAAEEARQALEREEWVVEQAQSGAEDGAYMTIVLSQSQSQSPPKSQSTTVTQSPPKRQSFRSQLQAQIARRSTQRKSAI